MNDYNVFAEQHPWRTLGDWSDWCVRVYTDRVKSGLDGDDINDAGLVSGFAVMATKVFDVQYITARRALASAISRHAAVLDAKDRAQGDRRE